MLSVHFKTIAPALGLGIALALGWSAGTASADEGVIRVGGVGNYGPVLPVFAGKKLGLFDKLGVKMEFTNYRGGAAAMEGMAAGEADLINFFPPGLALAMKRGVKATIVSAGTLTPRGWNIMVKADSPINDVKDLAGKKIGVTASGSTTDSFALWTAKQSGGDMSRVPPTAPQWVQRGSLISEKLRLSMENFRLQLWQRYSYMGMMVLPGRKILPHRRYRGKLWIGHSHTDRPMSYWRPRSLSALFWLCGPSGPRPPPPGLCASRMEGLSWTEGRSRLWRLTSDLCWW